MIGDLAFLAGTVVVVAVAGLLIGRMIASRIDRWQVRAVDQRAEQERAERERVDDSDSA